MTCLSFQFSPTLLECVKWISSILFETVVVVDLVSYSNLPNHTPCYQGLYDLSQYTYTLLEWIQTVNESIKIFCLSALVVT